MSIYDKIIRKQDALEVYKERMERMKLVSIAPLIFLTGLTLIQVLVHCLNKGVLYNLENTGNGYLIALLWFFASGLIIRQKRCKKFLQKDSTLFRFLFDLPILVLSLLWIIYCFYIINAFEYPFFLTFYTLCVYSASKMVTIPFYTFATNLIGIFLILSINFLKSYLLLPPLFFTAKDILENFTGLYIGLYFREIQVIFITSINAILKAIKYIFATLLEEP